MQSLEPFQRTWDLYMSLSSYSSAMALLSDPGMPKLKHWITATVSSGPKWIKTVECHMAHYYLLFSSVPDKTQMFQSSQTHTPPGKQQVGIFTFDSLLCSTIRCHQVPQQLLGILLSNSTMELWECYCHVPLESASRSVNNYSKPFFWLCCDFCVPFKKNKRFASKQNKSALSPQLTALCMELKQNYKMETEKSTVFILARFYCICSEKIDFWGWLCHDYPKKPHDWQ